METPDDLDGLVVVEFEAPPEGGKLILRPELFAGVREMGREVAVLVLAGMGLDAWPVCDSVSEVLRKVGEGLKKLKAQREPVVSVTPGPWLNVLPTDSPIQTFISNSSGFVTPSPDPEKGGVV